METKEYGFKVGDVVDYHSIIDGEVTSKAHVITDIGELGHGETVAWITNKRGCVSLKALSYASIEDQIRYSK